MENPEFDDPPPKPPKPSGKSRPSSRPSGAGANKAAAPNRNTAKPPAAPSAPRKPPAAPANRAAPSGKTPLVGRKLLGSRVLGAGNKVLPGARKPSGQNQQRSGQQKNNENTAEELPKDSFRGIFTKELPMVMFGYGDAERPLPETVDLVEDILVDYISDLTRKALDICLDRGKISVEDIMFLYRKDARKYARIKELLRANEELKKARLSFKEDAEVAADAVEEE